MRQKVLKVWNNPRLLIRALNREYHRITGGEIHSQGVSVFDRDWDNLILLDACRYDLFKSESDLPGDLQSVASRGTNTIQFLRANFNGRDLTDTVYVTSNPQFRKIEEALQTEFHAVVDLWSETTWNESIGAVLPGETTDAAVRANMSYPHKRLFIHYNQPHIPFIGDFGMNTFDIDEISAHPLPFWQQPMAGVWSCSDGTIWRAYRENLNETLPHVKRLLDELKGKTVVTSDHGNLIGERTSPIPNTEYGHPNAMYVPQLLEIPWLEVESSSRKEIIAERGMNTDIDSSSEEIQDRLQALGYH